MYSRFNKLFGAAAVMLFFIMSLGAAQESAGTNPDWFWGKEISSISFEDLQNVKKSDLTGVTSAYIGQNFTESLYSELSDRLYAMDVFDEITPYAKPDPKADGKILLIFKVKEHPVIKTITFSGNKKIRNGELRDTIKIKTDDVYVEGKVLTDERALRDMYLKKGYTLAKVTHTTETTANGVKVTFVIDEGASTVIASIKFQGNTVVSSRTLKGKISLKELGFLKDGAFQKSSLEADKQTIINYYQDRGYADARIMDVLQETELNEKKDRNELTITFIIQEGTQYTFNGVSFHGNVIFPTEKLMGLMKLKPGAVFNMTKFQESMQAVTSLYAESGYMTNQYTPTAKKDPDRKTISYDIAIVERSRSHIEDIIIKGNTKTKDYVIRREIPLDSGDVFSRDKLMTGLRNLYNLQYFSNIIPEPVQGSEENLVDIVISLEEQSTTSLNFGMTFSGVSDPTDIPVSLFAKWQNSNLFGEGKTISADTTVSTDTQSVGFTYGQNWLFNLPIALSESLSLSHSSEEALVNNWLPDGTVNTSSYYMKYQNWGVTLNSSTGRRWTPDFAILTLNAGVTDSLINNIYTESEFVPVDTSVSQAANRTGIINTIWTSFSVDNRDINYDPTKGWFVSQRVAWSGLIPVVEKEFFFRSDSKLEGYVTLLNIPFNEKWGLKLVLAGYTGLSLIYPIPGSPLSDSSKVYIDGMFNARGWTSVYNSTRGKAMLSNRLELRIPIVPNIVGIDGFLDAAAVKKDTNSIFTSLSLSDFYCSVGPGLRFLLPQFPLHLLFANTFRYSDTTQKFEWNKNWQFVLSFNLTNK